MKFWIDEILDGTTNDEFLPDERGIWFELLLLAGRANDEGRIKPTGTTLARILNASQELIDRTTTKAMLPGVNKLKIDEDGHFVIVKYGHYQPTRTDEFRENCNEMKRNETKCNEIPKSRGEEIRGDKEKEQDTLSVLDWLKTLNDGVEYELPAIKDGGYKEAVSLPYDTCDPILKEVVRMFAIYRMEFPYGTKFNTAEDYFRGLISADISIIRVSEQVRKVAKVVKRKNLKVWEVFDQMMKPVNIEQEKVNASRQTLLLKQEKRKEEEEKTKKESTGAPMPPELKQIIGKIAEEKTVKIEEKK